MHLREGSRDPSVIVLLFRSTEKENQPVVRSAEGQLQGSLRPGLTKFQGLRSLRLHMGPRAVILYLSRFPSHCSLTISCLCLSAPALNCFHDPALLVSVPLSPTWPLSFHLPLEPDGELEAPLSVSPGVRLLVFLLSPSQ